MSTRYGKKRLYIEVPFDLYEKIIENAELHNLDLTKWMIRTIFEKLKEHEKRNA